MQETVVCAVRVEACRHGTMMYYSHDRFIGAAFEHYGEYGEFEALALRNLCKPGDTVVEVGSNIGAHSVVLSHHLGRAGRLLIFEPQRIVFHMLCGNLALNSCWNTKALPEAVGSHCGMIGIPAVDYSKPGNFGGIEMRNESAEMVRLCTIDSHEVSPSLIKIDVEGMELDVLLGAEATIKRSRPILYVENDRRDKSAELINYCFKLGYDLWWHLPPLFNPNNFKGKTENLWPHIASANMLAVPCERHATVENCPRIISADSDYATMNNNMSTIVVKA
jgi:FkbM family methyltransferase